MMQIIDILLSVLLVVTTHLYIKKYQLCLRPKLYQAGNMCFLISMLPFVDDLARFSIFLHSLQSVMVHHLAPLLWITALESHRSDGSSSIQRLPVSWRTSLVLVGFAILTWVWMLPSLHPLLMDSALAYMLMKWLMALSGVALCLVMLATVSSSDYWQRLNIVTVIFPLLCWGAVMLSFPHMYMQTHHSPHHQHQMMNHLPEWLQLNPMTDQLIGGLIFFIAGILYWQAERSNSRLASHAGCLAK